MKDVSASNFGLLIAFLVPGLTTLWACSYFSEVVRTWLGGAPVLPTVGGFLYGTIGSVAAGMTVSTIRWMLIDSLHHATGIRPPALDFSRLQDNPKAFDTLVEFHYRYYQFHGNMLIAALLLYAAHRIATGGWAAPLAWTDVGFVLLEGIFFLGSRDTLRKYYSRAEQVLGQSGESGKTRLPGAA